MTPVSWSPSDGPIIRRPLLPHNEPDESTAKPEEQGHHRQPAVRSPTVRLHDSIPPQHSRSDVDEAVPSVAPNDGLHPFRLELVVHGGPADFGASSRPLRPLD